jgi:HSP20 family molecular chaperone IbpA
MRTLTYHPLASRQRSRFNEDVHVPINVSASDDEFQITAFVPGIRAEDLEIEVLDNHINIAGEFIELAEGEAMRTLREEMPTGRFQRSLRLRSKLDATKAEALVENGILTLTVPTCRRGKNTEGDCQSQINTFQVKRTAKQSFLYLI